LNQAELKQLSEERIRDAKTLLDGGRWEFAYYTAGYVVECALKSCVLARMIHTGWVFDVENKRIDDCRVHDFTKLVHIAGLDDELINRLRASATSGDGFVANWDIVKGWSVTTRYQSKPEIEAKRLYSAITDDPHGVLKWIRNY
jgi:HEPN domain-containing protein